MLRQKKMSLFTEMLITNAQKGITQCDLQHTVAIVFLMNDFPSMCEWFEYKRARSFGERPFQGKQGMFVIIHQK